MSDTPQRIQRKRTKGWQMPPNTVYVGRGTRWGNPYRVGKTKVRLPGIHGQDWEHEGRANKRSGEKHYFVHPDNSITYHWVQDATAEQCVELYQEYLSGAPYRDTCTTRHWDKYQASMQEEIRAELAGKNLACWCPLDQPCHADVLLEIANKENSNE